MPPIDSHDIPDDAPFTKTFVETANKVIEALPEGARQFIDNNLRGPFEGVLDSIVNLEHQVRGGNSGDKPAG